MGRSFVLPVRAHQARPKEKKKKSKNRRKEPTTRSSRPLPQANSHHIPDPAVEQKNRKSEVKIRERTQQLRKIKTTIKQLLRHKDVIKGRGNTWQ